MNQLYEPMIIKFLKQAYGQQLQGILLFGSQANGSATRYSDIDLGIIMDGIAEQAELWENAQILACQLKADVDLVDLRSATTVLQNEAINTGAWLWQKEPLICDAFELQVMAMYQQLQYDRRDILKALQQRLRNE